MKKITALLQTAAMLCVVLAGCVMQPAAPTTESTALTQQTTAPTTESTTGPQQTTAPTTESTTEFTSPAVTGNVPSPDEMPEKPENDYSLPPDEKPGDRKEVIDR